MNCRKKGFAKEVLGCNALATTLRTLKEGRLDGGVEWTLRIDQYSCKDIDLNVPHKLVVWPCNGHGWSDIGSDILVLAGWFNKYLYKEAVGLGVYHAEVCQLPYPVGRHGHSDQRSVTEHGIGAGGSNRISNNPAMPASIPIAQVL